MAVYSKRCTGFSLPKMSSAAEGYLGGASGGKLRLKGVKDSKVDKKKKKKAKSSSNDDGFKQTEDHPVQEFEDRSVVLKALQDEDEQIAKEKRREISLVDGKEVVPGAGVEDEKLSERLKTDAEKRFDEQRKKRLEERLKREGVKSHKQRVEDFNRYLSGLSEHHDMPRIGPG